MFEKFCSHFRRIWGIVKSFWWIVAFVFVVIVSAIIYTLIKRSRKKNFSIYKNTEGVVERVTENLQDSITDVKIENAIIKTKSAARRRELEEIKLEPDGKKRRDRLAKLVKDSI